MQPIQLPVVSTQAPVKKPDAATSPSEASFRTTLANAKKQQNTQAKEVSLGAQKASAIPSAKVKAAPADTSDGVVPEKFEIAGEGDELSSNSTFTSSDVNTQAIDMLSLMGNINLHLQKTEMPQHTTAENHASGADGMPLSADTAELVVPQDFIKTSIDAIRGNSEKPSLQLIKEPLDIDAATVKGGDDLIQDKSAADIAPAFQSSVLTQQPLAAEAAKHMSAVIAPRIANPGWSQALGQRVLWMVSDSIQSATLTLNPPDLGPVQVVLSVENDQASASFNTANPEVQQALESAMPKLRDMMESAGIKFGDATVSLGFSQQQSNQGKGANTQTQSQTDSSWNALGAEVATTVEPTTRVVQGSGLINTFA